MPPNEQWLYLISFFNSFAEKLLRNGYLNFIDKGHLYEKYDATNPIRVGGGGEYEVQGPMLQNIFGPQPIHVSFIS